MEKFDITKPPPPPPNKELNQCICGGRGGQSRESKKTQAEYMQRLQEYGDLIDAK